MAIHKRPMNGLLAGLYEFPNACGHPDADEIPAVLGMNPGCIKTVTPLPAAKHVFSHVEWHMTGYRVVVDEAAADPVFPGGREEGKGVADEAAAGDWFFVSREQLASSYAIPNAFQAYTALVG